MCERRFLLEIAAGSLSSTLPPPPPPPQLTCDSVWTSDEDEYLAKCKISCSCLVYERGGLLLGTEDGISFRNGGRIGAVFSPRSTR